MTKLVLLSFRGTEKKISDWITDLTLTSHDSGPGGYGKVHRGFYKGFDVVRSQVVELLIGAKADRKRLWITGHSLGAALAAIAGAELFEQFPATGFYTYGQPKLGRDLLDRFYREKFPGQYIRFRNNDDIVTRIPPHFKHVGDLFWFDRMGELKGLSPAGIPGGEGIESLEKTTELSEVEFKALQGALDAVQPPPSPDSLILPLADHQIEGLSLIPGFSVADHSIAKAYIPTIRKHLQREG